MESLFFEFSFVFIFVFILSYVLSKLKQPPIIGYIIAGILLGPLFFDMLTKNGLYEMFSQIGIAFLLFLVGIHLNISLIREVGIVSLLTGVGQIFFTIIISFFLLTFIGFSTNIAIILSIGVAFSSTIVIVKLLSDKKALETLYGKISLGFLLVQDFVAVAILLIIGTYLSYTGGEDITLVGIYLLIAIVIGIFLFILTRPFVSFLFKRNERSEIIFLFSIAWCFGIAALYDALGFSLEIGALLAGASLASTTFHHEISARIRPLRDFFIILFFIVLGSEVFSYSSELSQNQDMNFFEKKTQLLNTLIELLPQALLLSSLVLFGNPLIVFLIMHFLRYSSKVAFLSGLAVSQISEFSLIIGLLALQGNLITGEHLSILTLVMIITVFFSSYLFYNGETLYRYLKPFFKKFDHKNPKDKHTILNQEHEILFFGLNLLEERKLQKLKTMYDKLLVVENSTKRIHILKNNNIPYVYGDISNIEFLSEIPLEPVKVSVSFYNDFETNFMLVENIRKVNSQALVVVLANSEEEAYELYEIGADYVIIPHHIHHEWIFSMLEEYALKKDVFLKHKKMHLGKLKEMLKEE